jgi:hypothetical protein
MHDKSLLPALETGQGLEEFSVRGAFGKGREERAIG